MVLLDRIDDLGVPSGVTVDPPNGQAWILGHRAPNGRIYAVPGFADKVLKITPGPDALSTFGSGLSGLWASSVRVAHRIYCSPYGDGPVDFIDTNNDSIETLSGTISGGAAWGGRGGIWYAAGLLHVAREDRLVRVDPSDGSTDAVAWPVVEGETRRLIGSSLLAGNGWIYSPDLIKYDPAIATFDTLTAEFSRAGLQPGTSAVAANGDLCFFTSAFGEIDQRVNMIIRPGTDEVLLATPTGKADNGVPVTLRERIWVLGGSATNTYNSFLARERTWSEPVDFPVYWGVDSGAVARGAIYTWTSAYDSGDGMPPVLKFYGPSSGPHIGLRR